MITEEARITRQKEIQYALMQHDNNLEKFINDDDEPMSYAYLEDKLEKWMKQDDVEKVVSYYIRVLRKSFALAPTSIKLKMKYEVKPYLRKKLYI